ncbi:MAG: mechanosensitive ion channel family protein [Planctomycetota bacterium]
MIWSNSGTVTRGLPLIFVLLLALLPPAHGAQEEEQEPAATVLNSPREVMRVFLDNMRLYRRHGQERYLEAAISTFDEDGVPGAWSEEGGQVAVDLYAAFNRVEYVRFEDLPGPGELSLRSGYVRHLFGPPPSDEDAVIELAFLRGDDEGWRISKQSLARVPEIWARVKELPLIGDLPFLHRLHHRVRSALPAPLLARGFLLENWQWAGLAVLAFLGAVLDRLVRFLSAAVLRRLARADSVDLERRSVESFGRPLGLLAGASAFAWLLPTLDLQPDFLRPLDIAAAFVATVAGAWAAYRLVDVFCGYLTGRARQTATRFDDVLIPLLRRTLKILVAIVGLVYLASKWTDDLWGVVAGLGVGSIAVAFAGRDTIENLFGTFTVLLDRPFELGDWIRVGSNEGTVEDVGFRSTRIRTFYDSIITVPNRTFVTSDVDNMGRRRYRRIKTLLSLTYDTPPEKIEAFCGGVRRILELHPYTRKDYFHVYLNAMSASSLDVLLYAFVACPDWGTELREKHRLFADILRLAESLEVSFAFPTQTLHMARDEDLEHPDRPESDFEGQRRGQRVADGIVEKGLAPFGGRGAVPPPVASLQDPHARRGSEADGGE